MMLSDGPTCAGAILARGQENAEGRIGNTVEAFDEPTRQNRPALRVAPSRPPAASPRLADVPHLAARGSWRRRGSWRIGPPGCNAGWVDLITSCSSKLGATIQPGAGSDCAIMAGGQRSEHVHEHANPKAGLHPARVRPAHRARPGHHGRARIRCSGALDASECALFFGLRLEFLGGPPPPLVHRGPRAWPPDRGHSGNRRAGNGNDMDRGYPQLAVAAARG